MSRQEIQDKIKTLESEVNYLYDCFTRAATSRSGSILNQMLIKKTEINELKQKLNNQ